MVLADIGAVREKDSLYKGSNRNFYTGCSLTSGTAFNAIQPSGTLTGFGTAQNVYSTRLTVATSGTTTTTVDLSLDAGSSIFFTYFSNEAETLDGIRIGSIWIRSAGTVNCRIRMI